MSFIGLPRGGVRVACALFVVLACALSPALADEPASPSPSAAPAHAGGVHARLVSETPLNDAPGKKLSMVHVSFDPGGAMASHQHGGTVLVYVVAGAIRSQIGNGQARVFHAGESWIELPGVQHTVCENASATDPAELVATLVADDLPAGGDAVTTHADTLMPSGRHH